MAWPPCSSQWCGSRLYSKKPWHGGMPGGAMGLFQVFPSPCSPLWLALAACCLLACHGRLYYNTAPQMSEQSVGCFSGFPTEGAGCLHSPSEMRVSFQCWMRKWTSLNSSIFFVWNCWGNPEVVAMLLYHYKNTKPPQKPKGGKQCCLLLPSCGWLWELLLNNIGFLFPFKNKANPKLAAILWKQLEMLLPDTAAAEKAPGHDSRSPSCYWNFHPSTAHSWGGGGTDPDVETHPVMGAIRSLLWPPCGAAAPWKHFPHCLSIEWL